MGGAGTDSLSLVQVGETRLFVGEAVTDADPGIQAGDLQPLPQIRPRPQENELTCALHDVLPQVDEGGQAGGVAELQARQIQRQPGIIDQFQSRFGLGLKPMGGRQIEITADLDDDPISAETGGDGELTPRAMGHYGDHFSPSPILRSRSDILSTTQWQNITLAGDIGPSEGAPAGTDGWREAPEAVGGQLCPVAARIPVQGWGHGLPAAPAGDRILNERAWCG